MVLKQQVVCSIIATFSVSCVSLIADNDTTNCFNEAELFIWSGIGDAQPNDEWIQKLVYGCRSGEEKEEERIKVR